MSLSRKLTLIALVALLALPGRHAFAADDVQRVLHELDVSAANFHSTAADFEFDSYETDPIPQKDVQKGTIYYERKGSSFQMEAHIAEINGKPVPKLYSYTGGVLRLDEPMINQVTTLKSGSKFGSYLMLGFGASGKEIAEKWDAKYIAAEMIDGVKTEKLELVAKDPSVRKNLPKVTIWMDTARAISLKQVFDETDGQSRVSVYFNVKVNQPLPADAFKLKTDSKTTYVEH
jgi:outer membrane lipoprotein-sorting protein